MTFSLRVLTGIGQIPRGVGTLVVVIMDDMVAFQTLSQRIGPSSSYSRTREIQLLGWDGHPTHADQTRR